MLLHEILFSSSLLLLFLFFGRDWNFFKCASSEFVGRWYNYSVISWDLGQAFILHPRILSRLKNVPDNVNHGLFKNPVLTFDPVTRLMSKWHRRNKMMDINFSLNPLRFRDFRISVQNLLMKDIIFLNIFFLLLARTWKTLLVKRSRIFILKRDICGH